MNIQEKSQIILDDIARYALACGRNPGDIRLVAVSKTFPRQAVEEAIAAGLHVFGENRVQEAKTKFIPELPCELHLIGHLQSNKCRDAARLFHWIHSLDKETTAVKLDEECRKINKRIKVLLQVNTSGEIQKSGISPDQAGQLAQTIISLPQLELMGLMTIGPLEGGEKDIRNSFSQLRELGEELKKIKPDAIELSMGMSGDFKIAIEEGSTMVRIGSAIFGTREYSQ